MPASTSSLAGDNATDASYRTWIQAVDAALIAGGFVNPGDAGQTDLTTVLKPASANNFPAWRIYRSNDASGGLSNYYVKIEFGSASSAVIPSIRVTIGWSTDGAGTINSANKTSAVQASPSNQTTTGNPCNFSANGEQMCIGLFQHTSFASDITLSIERTRDNAGAKEDQLFWILFSNVTGNQGVLPKTGAIPTSPTLTGNILVPTSGTAPYAGNFGVGTIRPMKGGYLNDSGNLFFGDTTNFSAGQMTYTFQVYGETRTYISFNRTGNPTSARMLLRYD
jgi:hypothetical protein